uniref:Uncharacterized protein n=1 Tax=Oryza brachyantha TaxID=4533 RepID=J3LIK1_ORYBR
MQATGHHFLYINRCQKFLAEEFKGSTSRMRIKNQKLVHFPASIGDMNAPGWQQQPLHAARRLENVETGRKRMSQSCLTSVKAQKVDDITVESRQPSLCDDACPFFFHLQNNRFHVI